MLLEEKETPTWLFTSEFKILLLMGVDQYLKFILAMVLLQVGYFRGLCFWSMIKLFNRSYFLLTFIQYFIYTRFESLLHATIINKILYPEISLFLMRAASVLRRNLCKDFVQLVIDSVTIYLEEERRYQYLKR